MTSHRTSLLAAVLLLFAAIPTHAQNSSAKPLPNISTLMHQVLENQNRLDRIRENYACRDTRTVEILNKHGDVKRSATYVFQVSFLDGHEIHRLIEKDGRPLSPKAQKKEDDRIRKQVEKYERDARNGKRQAKREREAEITIQDFLRADRFSHPRRERLAGRPVIAFNFRANPRFKARTRTEKIVQALVGTVWIDAQAHEVVRLEARFVKNFKVGWGLVASVHRGTAVAFRQTLVHHQVWLPVYSQFHVSARALLFFGVNENQINRYSHYREFHVQSSSHPFPPKQP